MWRVTEVHDLIDHAAEVTVFVENDFLMFEQPHDSSQSGKFVTTETLYRANGEVVELPLIEKDPL